MIASTINWRFNLCWSTKSIIHSVFFYIKTRTKNIANKQNLLHKKANEVSNFSYIMSTKDHNNFRAKIKKVCFTWLDMTTVSVAPSCGASTNSLNFATITKKPSTEEQKQKLNVAIAWIFTVFLLFLLLPINCHIRSKHHLTTQSYWQRKISTIFWSKNDRLDFWSIFVAYWAL